MRSALAPLLSSARGDWQTPEVILDLVRRLGPIGLDPCTSPENPVNARRFYTPEEDGLKSSWGVCEQGELIYVNPPYGREIPAWVRRCAEMSWIGDEVIALVPARTDTKWFQSYCAVNKGKATAVCFWRGRLTFKGAPAPAPFPSAIVYWGDQPHTFLNLFQDHGLVWT